MVYRCVECGGRELTDFPTLHTRNFEDIHIEFYIVSIMCLNCGALYFGRKEVKAMEMHMALTIAERELKEGKYLKYVRKVLGYTIDDLSKLLYIEGVDNASPSSISAWESNMMDIPSECVMALYKHVYNRYYVEKAYDVFLSTPRLV
jgi:hypothetical protein